MHRPKFERIKLPSWTNHAPTIDDWCAINQSDQASQPYKERRQESYQR